MSTIDVRFTFATDVCEGLVSQNCASSNQNELVRRRPSGYGATAFAWLAEPKLTLREVAGERRLVSLDFTSWNQIADWLKRLNSLKAAA